MPQRVLLTDSSGVAGSLSPVIWNGTPDLRDVYVVHGQHDDLHKLPVRKHTSETKPERAHGLASCSILVALSKALRAFAIMSIAASYDARIIPGV